MALKTVSSFQLTPNWRHGGSTAKLRLYYSDQFVDNESRPVIGSSSFYDEANITIVDNVATVASFTLVTTEDSSRPNVKVSGVLYDQGQSMKETIFEWSVPSNTKIASPATFAALDAYNRRNTVINPLKFYLTQAQIIDLFNSLLAGLGVGPATNLALGTVLLSIAAADPANPEVWGTNDPLVRDALKLMGIPLDALMATPAAGNVPIFNAVTGKWEPNAAFAAVPAHGPSHQNEGADEFSVAGLSGLLADAQTPVTEAVQGIVGLMLTDSSTVDFSYDDEAGTATATVKAASIDAAKLAPATVNAQTGTTYTLQASDNYGIVTCDNAAAITVTVPAGLGAGFTCLVIQKGAGQVTFSPSSTTVNNRQAHTKTAGQHAAVSLAADVADNFYLGGDTA